MILLAPCLIKRQALCAVTGKIFYKTKTELFEGFLTVQSLGSKTSLHQSLKQDSQRAAALTVNGTLTLMTNSVLGEFIGKLTHFLIDSS